jgi:hypothetical protein
VICLVFPLANHHASYHGFFINRLSDPCGSSLFDVLSKKNGTSNDVLTKGHLDSLEEADALFDREILKEYQIIGIHGAINEKTRIFIKRAKNRGAFVIVCTSDKKLDFSLKYSHSYWYDSWMIEEYLDINRLGLLKHRKESHSEGEHEEEDEREKVLAVEKFMKDIKAVDLLDYFLVMLNQWNGLGHIFRNQFLKKSCYHCGQKMVFLLIHR